MRSRACARPPSAPTCPGRATTRTPASRSWAGIFPTARDPNARYHFITPGYTGRRARRSWPAGARPPSDGQDAPMVILVNESRRAQVLDDSGGRVGGRVKLWGKERTVVGVIGDVQDMPWHDRPCPRVYFPRSRPGIPSGCSWWRAPTSTRPSTVEPIRRALAESTRAAARQRPAPGERGLRGDADAPPDPVAGGGVRADVVLAGRRRDLRRDGPGRGPALAGVRRAPGAGRDARATSCVSSSRAERR